MLLDYPPIRIVTYLAIKVAEQLSYYSLLFFILSSDLYIQCSLLIFFHSVITILLNLTTLLLHYWTI